MDCLENARTVSLIIVMLFGGSRVFDRRPDGEGGRGGRGVLGLRRFCVELEMKRGGARGKVTKTKVLFERKYSQTP